MEWKQIGMIITVAPVDGIIAYVIHAEISEQKLRGTILGSLMFASAPVPQLLPKSVTQEEKNSRVQDAFLTKDAAA